jgi:hypothetical protein
MKKGKRKYIERKRKLVLGLDLENIDPINPMLWLASVRVVTLCVYGRWMGPISALYIIFY